MNLTSICVQTLSVCTARTGSFLHGLVLRPARMKSHYVVEPSFFQGLPARLPKLRRNRTNTAMRKKTPLVIPATRCCSSKIDALPPCEINHRHQSMKREKDKSSSRTSLRYIVSSACSLLGIVGSFRRCKTIRTTRRIGKIMIQVLALRQRRSDIGLTEVYFSRLETAMRESFC